MFKVITRLFILCLLPVIVFAQVPAKIEHVIYVTLDGTRWQDVFIAKRLPWVWKNLSDKVTWYGMPYTDRGIEVASIPVSLPSYQSQMAGQVQPCDGNDCGRIQVETLPEWLLQQFNFDIKTVATFSSWRMITYAVESQYGITFSSIGNQTVADPVTHIPDATMQHLNQLQEQDSPGDGDRFDKYTIAQALHYFHTYQPKFLWIALTEADEYAHVGNLRGYRDSFKRYDRFIAKLFNLLHEMNVAQNTMVIVTTDHGRGNGKNWVNHGTLYPASKRTWAFVYHGALLPAGDKVPYNTLSLRPTIQQVYSQPNPRFHSMNNSVRWRQ